MAKKAPVYPPRKIPFKPDAPLGTERYDMTRNPEDPYAGSMGYSKADKRAGAKYAFDTDYEDTRSDYEKYKIPSDPSSEDMSKRLGAGDRKAKNALQDAHDARHSSYYTNLNSTRSQLKADTPTPDEAIRGYKKGGSVHGGRGDGKVIRGRTKGRFV